MGYFLVCYVFLFIFYFFKTTFLFRNIYMIILSDLPNVSFETFDYISGICYVI
jgi:hypothetical protein